MPRTKKKYNERIELGIGPDGKRIRKWIRADTKAELEAKRRELIIDHEQVRNPSAVTLGSYSQKWYDTYKANKALATQSMYSYSVAKLSPLSGKPLRQVTSTDLQEIINSHWQHPRTCEQLKLTMKQIFNQAIRDGIVPPINQAADLELPPHITAETRFITDDEMEKILQIEFQPMDRLYIDVLRNTGMRPSEALALRYEDIYDDHIHVCRAFAFDGNNPVIKSTKTNVERDIPINSCLKSVLPSGDGYVFLKSDGKPFTKSAYIKMYNRIFSKISAVIGKNDLVMYSFRHTFATQMYYLGCRPGIISTKKAAQIMGHSEAIYIKRYTHIDDSKESVQEIVEKIGQVMGKIRCNPL